MRVERFEQAHQLAEGQLVIDAKGELWKAIHYLGDVQLIGFEGVENAFIVDQSGQGRPLGPEDDAPLPWLTVKVVPDDPDLSAYRTNSSTMCVCGDMATVLLSGAGNVFAPHLDRKTGKPCPGIPTSEPPVPAESLDWITRGPLTARVEESK